MSIPVGEEARIIVAPRTGNPPRRPVVPSPLTGTPDWEEPTRRTVEFVPGPRGPLVYAVVGPFRLTEVAFLLGESWRMLPELAGAAASLVLALFLLALASVVAGVGGMDFPVVWSIIGSALLVALLAAIRRS